MNVLLGLSCLTFEEGEIGVALDLVREVPCQGNRLIADHLPSGTPHLVEEVAKGVDLLALAFGAPPVGDVHGLHVVLERWHVASFRSPSRPIAAASAWRCCL